jgi:hypothetical protein
MRETQRKGDIAVTDAISTFTKLGMDVAIPITESAAYDIIVDDGGQLFKVQVRYNKSKEVELRRIHSNSNGYVVKKTKKHAYDWLYVLKPSGEKFLLKKCYDNRRSVTPRESDKIKI